MVSNALSQLQVFIDKNPFDSVNAFDWSDINYPSSTVTVIQLTGINKDIQKIITEMILWDLWYYKISHGVMKNNRLWLMMPKPKFRQ